MKNLALSGGGGKPQGGKMGTSINASVSPDSVAMVEKNLAELVDQLNGLHQKISNCIKCYQSSDRETMQLVLSPYFFILFPQNCIVYLCFKNILNLD